MKCWILAIGNELLNGEVLESNSLFLQRELLHYSIEVTKVIIVPDEENAIIDVIRAGIPYTSYLFITGGLGPTEDDVTRYAIAKALNRKLVQENAEQQIIKEKFQRLGYKMSANNLRQSFFPESSSIIANSMGTASGFMLTEKNCHIIALPGVPSELKHIYKTELVSLFNSRLKRVPFSYNKLMVKTMGESESTLDQLIKDKIAPKHRIRWEIIANASGLFLKFYPTDQQNNEQWKVSLKASLTECLNDYIYAYDDAEMNDIIATLLLQQDLTLGVVESCTGGLVSQYMTSQHGSSQYFTGGLVTYSNTLKINLAQVDKRLINQHGAVSSEVAEAMACGGQKVMGCDICLSITGIAGPSGGSVDKPVGTVWFGLMDHRNQVVIKKRIFNGNRDDVRQKSLFYGLNLIRIALRKNSG